MSSCEDEGEKSCLIKFVYYSQFRIKKYYTIIHIVELKPCSFTLQPIEHFYTVESSLIINVTTYLHARIYIYIYIYIFRQIDR